MKTPTLKRLFALLMEVRALQFGEFTLASGMKSPFYLDLRLIISNPELLHLSGQLLAAQVAELQVQRMAAVPYGALPLGSVAAVTAVCLCCTPARRSRSMVVSAKWKVTLSREIVLS